MSSPADIFAEIMRDERKRKNLTHRAIAEKLNLPPKVISDWEDRKRYPRLSSAIRWAGVLGFKMELERFEARHEP